ncbi:vacuolar membrane-associated protein iml1 [Malassezia sp. CBS 17886]|nr:vacuolar membrane-associated protein iml1 [Malassezia sp. CBS 17886]
MAKPLASAPRGAQGAALRSSELPADMGAATGGVSARRLVLWTHQPPNFSTHDVVMSPEYMLPQMSDAELLMVAEAPARGDERGAPLPVARSGRTLVFTPGQALADAEVIAKQHQLQLSVSRRLAGLFALANGTEVVLGRTSRAQHTVDHVELYFRDQYVGRSDMWRLATALQDTCVYVGQKIELPAGMRAKVGRIFINERRVLSGYMAPSSKTIFRSESAMYYVFIQMSREMWEFDEGGEIYYEKVLHGFLPDLLHKWDTIGTNHVVSVVLFTRVLYASSEHARLESLPVQRTAAGQRYVDYYKVVVDLESNCHWPSVMRTLKEEFFRFQHDILLQPRMPAHGAVVPPAPCDADLHADAVSGGRVLLGQLAQAHEGNLLQAVNLALNSFDEHFIDRDLTRTGLELVVVSAGTGQFHVDKALLRTTTQRMSEMGISMDLVCVTQMPLHTVPIFLFRDARAPPRNGAGSADRDRRRAAERARRARSGAPSPAPAPHTHVAPLYSDDVFPRDDDTTYYAVPYWINCSFYNMEQDRPLRADRFVPRCRMNGMRMMELMGSGQQDISIPYLELPRAPTPDAATALSPPSALSAVHGRSPPTGTPAAFPAARRAVRERFDSDAFRDVGSAAAQAAPTPAAGAGGAAAPPQPPAGASGGPPTPVHEWTRTPSLFSHTTRALQPPPSAAPGKARALVASTVTELVAVPTVPAHADAARTDTTASTHPSADSAQMRGAWPRLRWSVWPRLRSAWRRGAARRASRKRATGEDAFALISGALGAPDARDARADEPVLQVHAEGSILQLVPHMPADTAGGAGGAHGAPHAAPAERTGLLQPMASFADGATRQNPLFLRWQHVFLERVRHHVIKWWSMTSPACLPLTTQYLPTEQELLSDWEQYPYSLGVYSDTTSVLLKPGTSTSPAFAVLQEMCAQRLAQGFQFVERQVPSLGLVAAGLRDARSLVLRHPSELLRPGNFADGNPIYLSTTNQIHCISYNRPASMVTVTRYLKKTPFSTRTLSYRCCVWPRYQAGYLVRDASFAFPDPHGYNWTYLDSLIAGYEDTFKPSLRFWRARFVLVPSEGSPPPMTAPSGEPLSDEEVRLLGTDRLAELFARAELQRPNERRERTAVVRFLPTTLDPSASIHDVQFLSALIALGAALSRRNPPVDARRGHREATARPLDVLAKELRASAEELKINDRLWHRVLYPNTFTGTDLVNLLCSAYGDIRTRDDAVQLGRRLLDEGFIVHVLGTHSFLDGHYFMSRSMLIDLDPGKKSNHAEVAVLHHDLAHNAENGFNFQLHWLGTSARLIEDIVQSWTRIVERYGLCLVEAPIAQIKDVGMHNAFQAPLQIHLALPPPRPAEYAHLLDNARLAQHSAELPEPCDDSEAWLFRHVLTRFTTHADQLFEIALLRQHGFVLDQEASSRYPSDMILEYSSRPMNFDHTQFVHRSGVAFVQVLGGLEGFLWLKNRFRISHAQSSKGGATAKTLAQPPDANLERHAFEQVCGDRAKLADAYASVWRSLRRLAQEGG